MGRTVPADYAGRERRSFPRSRAGVRRCALNDLQIQSAFHPQPTLWNISGRRESLSAITIMAIGIRKKKGLNQAKSKQIKPKSLRSELREGADNSRGTCLRMMKGQGTGLFASLTRDQGSTESRPTTLSVGSLVEVSRGLATPLRSPESCAIRSWPPASASFAIPSCRGGNSAPRPPASAASPWPS